MLLSLLAALAPAAAQDPTTAAETLAALVERTNDLDAFHVTYEIEVREEGEAPKTSTLELGYVAPDLAHLRLSSADEGELETILLEETMYLRRPDTDGWQRVQLSGPPGVADEVEASFPSKAPLDPGIVFLLQPGSEGKGITLQAGSTILRRKALLGWLETMTAREDEVELEDEGLRWRDGPFELLVSVEHGFPA